jgi:glyoxylase-like metal-dependent hydrolase (beta-lactamase superfamily II)
MSSPTYTITPLDLGSVVREKSLFTYMHDFGTQIELRVISFLLRGDGRTVLVDTGGPPVEQALAGHLPYVQSADQALDHQLRAHEVDPAEVDAVIYTHLHWDHAYNTAGLRTARFFVSRRELEFARDPCPIQDWMYDARSVGGDPDYEHIDFEFTSPGEEVLPGIVAIPTPGHSPGHQSLVVPTAAGPFVLAGDLSPLQQNWERRIPNGMLHNLEEHFASFDRLAAVGGTVVASHDPRTLLAGQLPAPAASHQAA